MSDAGFNKQALEQLLSDRFPSSAPERPPIAEWQPATSSAERGGDDAASTDLPNSAAEPVWYRRVTTRHYAGGLVCFLAGALFWNFVGVWQVVSDIVEHSPAEQRLMRRVMQPDPEVKLSTRHVVNSRKRARDEAKTCTQLILDRETGTVSKASCELVLRGGQASEPAVERPIGQTAISKPAG